MVLDAPAKAAEDGDMNVSFSRGRENDTRL